LNLTTFERIEQTKMKIIVQNIVIPARNFGQTVAFYRDILALPVLQEAEGYCFLRAGGVNIAIHPAAEEGVFVPTGHGLYLDLIVDNLSETRLRLAEASILFLREWVDQGAAFLAVADPSGNRLELYEGKT
jgi:catechol 2,3-dioxygenase-like lactoylglutathione lyase family enzyme